MKVLQRLGYGASFNELTIDEGKIIKKCKNMYGLNKIKYEIEFYRFIKNRNIDFPVVKVLDVLDNGYIMEYLDNYKPLYKTQFNIDDVYKALHKLHDSLTLKVSKEYFMRQLNMEIDQKIHDRYNSIKDKVRVYDSITHVNGIRIIPFQDLLNRINGEIYNLIDEYIFVPIHGDCQFNNILSNGNEIVFIDPRGYFGESSIFGMKEYDFAKVLFALSGYDEFDSREINSLDIHDNTISIRLNSLDTNIFNRPKLEVLLMLNIWMGNAHSFIENECKMIYSYFISLYLGSIYFSKK